MLLICNCMLTQKQNMQLGSVKFLRVIIFSVWNCHFLVRGVRHLLTSFRNMKNSLQSSGVILLKDQEYGNLDHVDGWLKFPYVSLCQSMWAELSGENFRSPLTWLFTPPLHRSKSDQIAPLNSAPRSSTISSRSGEIAPRSLKFKITLHA